MPAPLRDRLLAEAGHCEGVAAMSVGDAREAWLTRAALLREAFAYVSEVGYLEGVARMALGDVVVLESRSGIDPAGDDAA